jgi:hypothetical protein
MNMFDNYNNGSITNTPNNLNDTSVYNEISISKDIPKEVYDINNQFVGYTWNHGDIFTFELNVNDVIKVHKYSLIYTESKEEPSTSTIGFKGQKAYNIKDRICWTCLGIYDDFYVWSEDEDITYDESGTKEITFETDMTDKSMEVTIYNFRWEPIKTFSNSDYNCILIDINTELSKELVSGLYKCRIRINDGTNSKVKKEFDIIIK